MIYKSFYQQIQKTTALKIVSKLSDGLFPYSVGNPSYVLNKLSLYSAPNPPHRLELRGSLGKAYNDALAATKKAFIPSGYQVQPLTGLQMSTDYLRLLEPRGFSFYHTQNKPWEQIASQIAEESSKLMDSIIMDDLHFITPPALISEHNSALLCPSPLYLDFPAEVMYLEAYWGVPLLEHLARVMPLTGSRSLYLSQYMSDLSQLEYVTPTSVLSFKISDLAPGAPYFLLDQAFEIIDEIFNPYREQRFNSANSRAVLFDWLRWYFINTPIMIPDGGVIQKTHGIVSGSFFTYPVHTIIDYLLAQFIDEYLKLNSSLFLRSEDVYMFYLSSTDLNPLLKTSVTESAKPDTADDFETLCRVFDSQFNMTLGYDNFAVISDGEYKPQLTPALAMGVQWTP